MSLGPSVSPYIGPLDPISNQLALFVHQRHQRCCYFNHHHHHQQYSTAIECHQYSKFQNALSHLFEAGPSEVAKYTLHPGLAMLKEFCRLKVAAAA